MSEEPDEADEIEVEPTASDESSAATSAPMSQRLNVDEAFCSSCGEIIKKEAEICPHCGVRHQSAVAARINQSTPAAGEKNAGLAALASLIIPGAGQVYNGQIAKGLIIMVLNVISFLSIAVLIGFITTPVIYIYAIYDAYQTAEKINSGQVVV